MTTMSTSAGPTWRAWVGLVLLALPLFMMATDFTVMFMTMPAVTADLAPSTTQTLWIMHIGEFVAAGFVITMGWLTGRIGPRTLLLIAMGLYGLASALAAFAPNAEALLTARVLTGLATAAASPAAISLLRSIFTSTRHFGIAFAVLMGAFSVGGALGPPMGGVLLAHFWWGSVFLINVPVAAVVLFGGLSLFPRGSTSNTERIDMISVVLSIGAVLLLVFGLQEIADRGVSLPYVLTIMAGIGLGIWFVRRQRHLTNPLLDLRLFSIRALRMAAIALALTSVAFVGVDFLLVQYLQIVSGVPTGRLGLLLAAPGIAAIIGSALAPILARRIAPGPLTAAGVGLSLVGALTIIAAIAVAPQLTWLFIAGTTAVALGVTPLMLLGAQLIVTSAPKARAGSAVAIQDVSAGLGGALGMALVGSLAMAVFGRVLTARAPAGLGAAEVEAATQSPGGAVATATDVGGADGQALLTAAHGALSWGTAAAYGAAVVVGGATIVLLLRGLRGITLDLDTPESGTEEPEPVRVGSATVDREPGQLAATQPSAAP
ncbi:DHA2 family multidrug resistance protein-like MFS transporter [Tamaricihabitans halophyticus]|uniref:DHA2 family multidrug resistance protein-like MFS transporter n=1 Tax=Tamaricihabitans halophyticus TaxID=1262583 RepID=A0A4R2QXW6_9PSEU|nr:MFS transporter [Tamaricihabitans halophyticus]TCP55003.1 DHA2 family multidrug resistance protein-like MFS transporter [Tamaricihabitans halophyticus]